jgi:hypothetical protein
MRALSALLEQKCQYENGEVDIVLLQHTFEIERADGKLETMTSTLEAYGDRNGGHGAMVCHTSRILNLPLTHSRPSSLVSHVVLPFDSSSTVSSPSQESTLHTTRR